MKIVLRLKSKPEKIGTGSHFTSSLFRMFNAPIGVRCCCFLRFLYQFVCSPRLLCFSVVDGSFFFVFFGSALCNFWQLKSFHVLNLWFFISFVTAFCSRSEILRTRNKTFFNFMFWISCWFRNVSQSASFSGDCNRGRLNWDLWAVARLIRAHWIDWNQTEAKRQNLLR